MADMLGGSLPTPMVLDMVYAASARRATPCPQAISSTTAAMVRHSRMVDAVVPPGAGVVATVGKHWVLDKKLETSTTKACNYGWHFVGSSFQGIKGYTPASPGTTGSGVSVIQQNATAHDLHHSDYSQVCQLVSQQCWIGGIERTFSEVVTDPVLGRFVSHQGRLSIDRQPGVGRVGGPRVVMPVSIVS